MELIESPRLRLDIPAKRLPSLKMAFFGVSMDLAGLEKRLVVPSIGRGLFPKRFAG